MGGGCFASDWSDGSRHAHEGALDAQMLIEGRMTDGSSRVPSRTTRIWGVEEDAAKRWHPHVGQKYLEMVFPLSALLSKHCNVPVASIAVAGNITLAVPLPEIFWQVLHQQTRETTGSP